MNHFLNVSFKKCILLIIYIHASEGDVAVAYQAPGSLVHGNFPVLEWGAISFFYIYIYI